MRLVFISDTHNRLNDVTVPDGDVLIHSGDFCMRGNLAEVQKFSAQLEKLPHPHKIVVAGNHDWSFVTDNAAARAALAHAIYLQDELIEIGGLKFYGSPWQPQFHNWAFNLPRGSEQLRAKWAMIPENIDILVTHGPPKGILDKILTKVHVGDELLLKRVLDIRPKIHCFGHIHESYGQHIQDGITFINASSLNMFYQPANCPIVLDL